MDTTPTPPPEKPYLTPAEAGQFLALSPRTLEKMRTIGGGPRFHKFGRRISYARKDLAAWAAERQFDSTSDPEYLALRSERL